METGGFVEWRIENFSYWCPEVHGDCIHSPNFSFPCSYLQLYPKDVIEQGEHLVLFFCDLFSAFSGEITFHGPDESLLFPEQLVSAEGKKRIVLHSGPKFEDVISRIREAGDFIIVRCRIKDLLCYEQILSTTINVLKISINMEPGWIEKMESDATKDVCYIMFSPIDSFDRMELNTSSVNNIVHFMIRPPTKTINPFAVEICIRLKRSDGTVDKNVKKEHVFRNNSSWTFTDPLDKKELDGKGIYLFLCLKTCNLIQSPCYTNCDYNNVCIQLHNTPCFPTKRPPTDPVTSNKVAVLTKDSGSLTSDIPYDSVLVLSKDLMCLYQDQKISDLELKCDNVSFPVHKNILSARSPVFDRLFCDVKEAASGTVNIGDLDPSTLGLFLTYLYTGTVEDLHDASALKLYYAADKYQVPSLKRQCNDFLCSNVSFSNVCDILSLADKHRSVELTAASHDFILDNYNAVLKSKEWDTLKKNKPLLAVNTLTQFAVEDRVDRKHPPH